MPSLQYERPKCECSGCSTRGRSPRDRSASGRITRLLAERLQVRLDHSYFGKTRVIIDNAALSASIVIDLCSLLLVLLEIL
jgi:hypothetical protein